MEQHKFCCTCGIKLPMKARFCMSCGEPQPEMPRRLEPEPAPIPTQESIASPCSYNQVPSGGERDAMPLCDSPVLEEGTLAETASINAFDATDASEQSPGDAVAPEPKRKRPPMPAWCKPAILLALSLVMLVMAFLPVVKLDFGETIDEDLDGMTIDISPVRSIVLAIDSLQKLDEEDIINSDLMEQLRAVEEKAEEIGDDIDEDDLDEWEDFPPSLKRLTRKSVLLGIRLALQSENSAVGAMFYLTAVLGLLHLLLCGAAAVVSLLALLSSVGVLQARKRLEKAAMMLFYAVPMLALVLYFAMHAVYGGMGLGAPRMAISVVVTLPVAAMGLVVAVIWPCLSGVKLQKKALIREGISLAVAMILFGLLFVPVLSIRVETEFDGKSRSTEEQTSVDVAYFYSLVENYEENYTYYDLFDSGNRNVIEGKLEDYFDEFSYYSAREFRNGEANNVAQAIIVGELVTTGALIVATAYGHFAVLYFIVAVGLALFGWQMLCNMSGIYTRCAFGFTAKALSVSGAAMALVLNIVFVLIVNFCVEEYGPKNFGVAVGAGTILLLSLTIVWCIASAIVARKSRVSYY